MSFAAEHIDSILMIFLGVALFATAAKASDPTSRRARFIRVGSVVVIAGGALLLISPGVTTKPVVQVTANGVAQITFPGKPSHQLLTAAEIPEGVERETYQYRPPGKDVNFRLSRSPITGEALGFSHQQRLETMVQYFRAQQFEVESVSVSEVEGIPIHAIVFAAPRGEATLEMRVAFHGDEIYRAIATVGKNEQRPPDVDSFLASFKIHPLRSRGNAA